MNTVTPDDMVKGADQMISPFSKVVSLLIDIALLRIRHIRRIPLTRALSLMDLHVSSRCAQLT